jgi:hypothetical protein
VFSSHQIGPRGRSSAVECRVRANDPVPGDLSGLANITTVIARLDRAIQYSSALAD